MPDPDLIIRRWEVADGVGVLRIAGEIDLASANRLKQAFELEVDWVPPLRDLRADLAAVEFMDSVSVVVLLQAGTRALKRGSQVVVTSASPFWTACSRSPGSPI